MYFTLSLLAAFFTYSDASSFLSRAQDEAETTISPELQSTIMQGIENMLVNSGDSDTLNRIGRIQDMLRTTFKAMPKNEEGKLPHAAVRYTLHGYFVQRHAWYVRGLAETGAGSNSSSPSGILQDHVEEFVQGVFEQRLGSHGLDLREVAVLAATFENLVNHETKQRLDATIAALGLSTEDMPVDHVDTILDAYMMTYLLNVDSRRINERTIGIIQSRIHKAYPGWNQTQTFLRGVRESSGFQKTHYSRGEVDDMVREVGDQYGRWQNRECQDLKHRLLALEDKTIGTNGSGRVRINHFYGSAVKNGNWQFSETEEYLSQLGALDAHDPNIPRVIIPNYINSPSNCVAGSKYYSVCCINECEGLIDNLEHHFVAPSATPSAIIEAVSNLASSTVEAGRTLHPILQARLDEIAEHHGGLVPLHGRLFSQWMHHAYPRECPYPHRAGSVKPQRLMEYKKDTKVKPTHTKDALQSKVEALPEDTDVDHSGQDECTAWSHHEEMYVERSLTKATVQSARPLGYLCILGAFAVGAVARVASWSRGSKVASSRSDKSHSQFV